MPEPATRGPLGARSTRAWPFGPKHIEKQYLHADPRLLEVDADDLAAAGVAVGERRSAR
jgi:hypothetical protein